MNTSQAVQEEVSGNSVGIGKDKYGGSILGGFGGSDTCWSSNGIPNKTKIIMVVIYAPQQPVYRRALWDYISILLRRWTGEAILMGDFNEVRSIEERRGSWFNASNARMFNHFISFLGLIDIKMEGYSFTWSHPLANKMSKLDRFPVSDGIISLFPSITAICMDRHLSDHHPILLCEVKLDFGPIPFRFFHSWFNFDGFDAMVEQTWRSLSHSDNNRMVRFKKKLQDLKKSIRIWINEKKLVISSSKQSIVKELGNIDKDLDQGRVSDSVLFRRQELNCQLNDIKTMEASDSMQKSKVKWAIEGDENSKFFHGIINKKRSHLAVRGIFDEGSWITDPSLVKKAFLDHFELSCDQAVDLERVVSHDEIRSAVWDCRENKSPGPDGFTFEFFRKFWDLIVPDFCGAVEHFFENGSFSKGCNSSFIALIPKVIDAKFVNDYRPISLIGRSVNKVVTKIMLNGGHLLLGILFNTQSAFVAERQILDGPFILNEVLQWCKRKNKKAMFFKVDFAKAYDSVRWDFLIDVLEAFGFGPTWCNWIRGTFCFAKASILVNGSPSNEFQFHRGLKQGDPLSPYLFILIMESLHLSVSRAVNDGLFKGIRLHSTLSLSHLFYADDALFIGEWSDVNLRGIIYILKCFYLASGLQINISKSQVMGVGVSRSSVEDMAASIGCSIMETNFRYLGVMVGECMSRHKAWDDVVAKLRQRLSKWKAKTLSIGGRLTLLKSVLGASPLYSMSIFKVPKGVLKVMESIRSNFFKGADPSENKILWVAWDKILASKKKGAIYGDMIDSNSTHIMSIWSSILKEVLVLKSGGFDFLSFCNKRIGDGLNTHFWLDTWKGDKPFRVAFLRLFALESNGQVSVAEKLGSSLNISFRRKVRGGLEEQQYLELSSIIYAVSLSSSPGRWECSLSSDGVYSVKQIQNAIDDLSLPSFPDSTRWVKAIPIKINLFAWRAWHDCLPTRSNLIRRGVTLDLVACPICLSDEESVPHIFFRCNLAQEVLRRVCVGGT
ncbi:RNA-directed DNA polymerase, eukaryota [Tanacetum coccineum]